MTFADWTNGIIGAISSFVIPVIVALCGAAFLWGVVKYFFLHGDDEAGRAEGRQFVLWGLLGLVVLFAVWAIVNILLSTLGLSAGSN